MIIDHIGFILFPEILVLRAIGRLAFPLFAYQMAVGFSHTRNKEKHILKLLLFSILCQIPHNISLALYELNLNLNIIFTFVISLLIIYCIEHFKFTDNNNGNKTFSIRNCIMSLASSLLILSLGIHLNVDYGWYGILLTVAFYFTLNKKLLSILLFYILIIFYFALSPNNYMTALACVSLFDILFILLFNGKQGYKNSWIFYALYFFHLFPLFLIKSLMP
jgi:hypothetical protein